MTTPSEALARLKSMLHEMAYAETPVAYDRLADDCLAMLPIIESAMVPEFTEECEFVRLDKSLDGCWYAIIRHNNKIYEGYASIRNNTPRAAILAAKEKVKP